MSPDIDAVTAMLQEEKVWTAVKAHVEEFNATQVLIPPGGIDDMRIVTE